MYNKFVHAIAGPNSNTIVTSQYFLLHAIQGVQKSDQVRKSLILLKVRGGREHARWLPEGAAAHQYDPGHQHRQWALLRT